MKHLIAFLAAWQAVVASAAAAAGQVIHLEGQVVASEAGFELTPLPFIYGASLPVPYSGIFTYEPGGSRATFEIVVGGDLGVGWPSVELFGTDDFRGAVQNDATRLAVDLSSPAEPWVTSLALSLDKSTGQGEWRWSEAPPLVCTPAGICAPSVPGSAVWGTITAFREVPEPGTLAMVGALGVWKWRRRNLHRSHRCGAQSVAY